MADFLLDYSRLTPEEQWENATIANNYIFYYVMHENPDICKEAIERLLHRAYKYFFISSKYGKIQNEKQRNFLQLVMNNEKTDELSSKILEKVKSAKQNVLVRKGYMDLIREKAYAAKAAEKRKADEDAIALLKEGDSVEKVSRCIKLPLEHVKELAAQLKKNSF